MGHSIKDQTKLVHAALDMGINIFDTASHYGHSESILGNCLSGVQRDSFFICTKWPARDETDNTVLDPTKLIESVNKSLARLQTDYIDIMLFHGIMPDEYLSIVENLYPTMAQLKSEGKIRSIGFSSRFSEDPEQKSIELGLSQNPDLWELINRFNEKTDVPALVNTSFNLHGKPIVKTFKDALYVFENSGLDVLWLDNHIIEKIE